MGKQDKEKLEGLDGVGAVPTPDPGPLAPWKLSISVGASAALTGSSLYDAALTGVALDMALMRSFGVAFSVWIAVGFVNKVLRQALEAVDVDAAAPTGMSPRPWVDERSGESTTA